ncbi:MAG: hypothetical protein RMJ88_11645 [Thermogemmata sp.]|nr:hypothetical protein [Thermogemmata sp.]
MIIPPFLQTQQTSKAHDDQIKLFVTNHYEGLGNLIVPCVAPRRSTPQPRLAQQRANALTQVHRLGGKFCHHCPLLPLYQSAILRPANVAESADGITKLCYGMVIPLRDRPKTMR